MSEKNEAVTEEKKTSKEAVMYIGPTFMGAAYASVYTKGIPAPLEEKVKAYPLFEDLLVPLSEVVEARALLNDKGSALSKCYSAAKKIIDEED